ncbi:unnamed protein product [Gadus morhua 'NCC']
MKHLIGVHHSQTVLLLAAAMVLAHSLEASSYNLANERSSIERTYELTKYLEHQLKEIKDTYLSYLGPPFNEKDFSPPRPNSTALSLPSAATRLELWRGLENRARLAQNQRAYSVLLAAVQELARSTLCPYLQTSLLHFCTGLDGLLVSISGLMSGLGHAPPPPPGLALGGGALVGEEVAAGPLHRPAPLLMSQRGALGTVAARDGRVPFWALAEEDEEGGGGEERGRRREAMERRRGKEGRRRSEGRRSHGWRERTGGAERGRRGRRGRRGAEPADQNTEEEEEQEDEDLEEEQEVEGGLELWGQRRRLLSVLEELWEETRLQGEPQRGPSLWATAGGEAPRRPPGPRTNSDNNNNNNNNNDNNNNDNSNNNKNNNNNDKSKNNNGGDSYNYDSYVDNQYSYNLNYRPADTVRREDSLEHSLEHSLEDSLEDSLEHSLKDSLEDHLEDSLENSLDQRLGDSLEDSSDTGYLLLPDGGSSSSSSSLRRHPRSLPPPPPPSSPPPSPHSPSSTPLGRSPGGRASSRSPPHSPSPCARARPSSLLLSPRSSPPRRAPPSPPCWRCGQRSATSPARWKASGSSGSCRAGCGRSAKDFNRLKKRLRG